MRVASEKTLAESSQRIQELVNQSKKSIFIFISNKVFLKYDLKSKKWRSNLI